MTDYFHGSNYSFRPGQQVLSSRDQYAQDHGPDGWDDYDESEAQWHSPYAYATTNPDLARGFGRQVFKVAPTGPVYPDDNTSDDPSGEKFMSESPWRVLNQHQFGG